MTGGATISRRAFLLAPLALALRISRPGAAASDLAFLVIGDWGRPSTGQRRVAGQMGKVAEAIGARFVISTGDNFYRDGVASLEDPLWRTAFEDVYTAPSLQVPWYVALGNHDHKGDVRAQIAYSERSARWRMPDTHFRHTEAVPGGGALDLFFLDTEPIKRGYADWIRRLTGFFSDDQLAWLDRELAASTARWKIVIGHHPVFSGGSHQNTPALVAWLKPILERHKVQVYLNGHCHNLEHVVIDKVNYLTSGAGARPRPAGPVAGTRFVMGNRLGFLAARVNAAAMTIQFVDDAGTVLYEGSIPVEP
jgi:tartrate-resistant acid phosphatase type 5